MRVNNTFRSITDCFLRKHCRDSPCQTSFTVFQKWTCVFSSLTPSQIGRWQIVTDTCKNNVSKFIWKSFKSPLPLHKWKCCGEASLFNCISPILTTIHSLKNCSVYGRSRRIYSPKSFGFFRKEFFKFKKINNYVIYMLFSQFPWKV